MLLHPCGCESKKHTRAWHFWLRGTLLEQILPRTRLDILQAAESREATGVAAVQVS